MKNYHLLQTTAVLFFILVHFSACSKKENPKPPVQTPISLSVNKGPYNTSVVITGTGFSMTVGDDKVFFNGNVAVTTAATATQLTATVPLGAGSGAVTVKLKNGTVLNGPDFTYQLSLVVSTFAGSGD